MNTCGHDAQVKYSMMGFETIDIYISKNKLKSEQSENMLFEMEKNGFALD